MTIEMEADARQAALDRLDELGETAMVFELGGSHIIRAAPAINTCSGDRRTRRSIKNILLICQI